MYQIFYTRSIPFPIKLPDEPEWAKFDLCLKISEGLQDMENERIIPGAQTMEKLKQKLEEEMQKNTLPKLRKGEAISLFYLDFNTL